MIPIYVNHEHDQPPIGTVYMHNDKMYAEFYGDGVTLPVLWGIFGNPGILLLEQKKLKRHIRVIRIQLLEFSATPKGRKYKDE